MIICLPVITCDDGGLIRLTLGLLRARTFLQIVNRGQVRDRKNQGFIISGESGAGKTETAKIATRLEGRWVSARDPVTSPKDITRTMIRKCEYFPNKAHSLSRASWRRALFLPGPHLSWPLSFCQNRRSSGLCPSL